MSVMRYLVPALAIAGRAAAQQSASCSAATTTLQSQGDASALAACSTFTGTIAIATGTTDNMAINGVQEIQGSIIVDQADQFTQLSGDSLETITGTFSLNGLTILSTLNFPRLTNVDQIEWIALPALQSLSFSTGVQTASLLSIQNTQLNSLSGIDLQVADTILIANNPYLEEINMQLGNITTSLIIEANGRMVQAIFPNLDWAYNMTFRNVSSVSIPSLASLNGSMGFYSNSMESISAPNLTSVGGSLSFVNNEQLTNISMPGLKTINGGFQIANNTALEKVSDFGALATVSGALDFNGNMSTISLPALADVKGAFNLQSSGDISAACSTFSPLSGPNNVIKGTYTCDSAISHPGGAGSQPAGTNTGSGSKGSASPSSAGVPLYIPGTTGLLGVVAAIFGIML